MRGGGEGVPADVCGDGLVIKAAISAEAADDAAGTAAFRVIARSGGVDRNQGPRGPVIFAHPGR
jgi:hypothetical protein